MVINLPNFITLGRLLSVPLAVWLILSQESLFAFRVFIAAAVPGALGFQLNDQCFAFVQAMVYIVVVTTLLSVGAYVVTWSWRAAEEGP